MRTVRMVCVCVLAAFGLLFGGIMANAAVSGNISDLSTTGASFTKATYKFDPLPCKGCTIIGFNYWGTLKDTLKDKNRVFVHGKIDGYSWAPAVNTSVDQATPKSVGQKVYKYDPPGSAQVQVCRNRTGIWPNNCKTSAWIYR